MKDNDENIKDAYDVIPVSIIILDDNEMISYLNKTALQLINMKHDDVLGKHFEDLFHFNSKQSSVGSLYENCDIKKAITLAYSRQTTVGLEVNSKSLINENDFWFKVSINPVMIDNKVNVVITLIDITQNKKEELSLIQSSDFRNNLLNQIPAIVWKINKELKCVYVNMGWESLTGVKIEEALGYGLIKVLHPDDLCICKKVISEANSKREAFQVEARLRCYDGEYRHFLISGTPYYNLKGQFDGYIGTNLDITESKKVIVNLNRYQKLVETTDDIILFIDLEGRIIDANKSAVKAYGYTYEELCSINIRNIRADWGYTKKQMEIANKTGISFEAIHRRKDGSYFDVEVSSCGTDMDNRRILVSIVRDITERKLAEQKLREQEELFRTLFEQSPIGMALCNPDGEITDVNPMYEKIFGRTKDEMKRIGWHSTTHPDDLYKDLDNFNKYKTGELKQYSIVKRYIRPDGSIVWGNLTLTPLLFKNNNVINVAMVEDITERIQAEQALKKSESLYKAVITNSSDVISILDECGKPKYISSNISKIYGWDVEDIISTSVWDRIHTDDVMYIQQVFNSLLEKENSQKTVEFRYKCKDGSYKAVELTANNLIHDSDINGILLNYRDITDRKEKENEIQYLNYHDVLTGLNNRRFFKEKLKQLNIASQLPLSVIIADINGLRHINEAFGHARGDDLIIAVSQVIKSCIRKQDILTRTGGDEFSILLPNTNNEDANKIMKRIEQACEDYSIHVIYQTSISFGCATKTEQNEEINDIVKRADDNMQQHKLLKDESFHSSIVLSMKSSLYEKSQETEEHAQRLILLSKTIGQKLNLSDKLLNELELLSTLHDIGKIGIKDEILNKDGKLTNEEWAIMKTHPDIGYRIAMSIPELQPISNYILCHHERVDGTGYPNGLKGEDIPLLSRIIAVVDAYDAMTSDRIYRKALSKQEAIIEIKQNMGTQFDSIIASIFIDIVSDN